jgi:hypothetical protein
MDIRAEKQRNAVADEVSALIAVVRPILLGLLASLKTDLVDEVGGRENVKVSVLARLYRAGDGDCGICFEYAVHDAMRQGDGRVLERVDAALTLCNVPGDNLDSILFAIEKSGSEQIIDTAHDLITTESRLLSGSRGGPVKLHKHMAGIAQAFRRPEARLALPSSISGLWKADLFLGKTDSDRWVGTSVKINPTHLEGARGLRVGIVPAKDAKTVCPLLYDGDFVELFYYGWQIVQTFLRADARVPSPADLPGPALRLVAKMLSDRRDYPVTDVVEALAALAQPELLETEEDRADVVLRRGDSPEVQAVIVPEPRRI